jgi:hypothetical protein
MRSSSKLANLRKGLSAADGQAADTPPPVAATKPKGASYKAPSREGRAHISAVLPPAYKRSIRAVQVVHDKPLQHLIAEALNLLFEKYNVPTVSE